MLESLAIWYLRKRKRSVIIGYELKGGKVRCLNDSAYIYDNNISNTDYRCKDDSSFQIPKGKFKVEFKQG